MGPYKGYDNVTFETDLQSHFKTHFGEDIKSEDLQMNVMGKTPAAERGREIVSKTVLAVFSIGLVVMLYFIGRYCCSPKGKQPSNNEEAPLLIKEPTCRYPL